MEKYFPFLDVLSKVIVAMSILLAIVILSEELPKRRQRKQEKSEPRQLGFFKYARFTVTFHVSDDEAQFTVTETGGITQPGTETYVFKDLGPAREFFQHLVETAICQTSRSMVM